ncbi:MAG: hypothetical protein BWY75_01715 [bacterium ADurb.Bin425]|jgi:hypothetical protein|nr:MAG: hypothetical protein BWY75_01715 [bacterium ADurb.Bin425]
MLFDVLFFGFPLVLCICMGAHAIREADRRFWMPAFSFFSYCLFYLAGGRDVILYLTCCLCMMGGWASFGFGL